MGFSFPRDIPPSKAAGATDPPGIGGDLNVQLASVGKNSDNDRCASHPGLLRNAMSAAFDLRRACFTSGLLLVATLVAEIFLWCSERLGWFHSGEHPAWMVLIAVVVAGGAILLMVVWFLASFVFRLRFQFALSSLLILPVIIAIPCGWLCAEMSQARRQRQAAAAMNATSTFLLLDQAYYDYEVQWDTDRRKVIGISPKARPASSSGMGRLLGQDFFSRVVWAAINSETDLDARLRSLEDLPGLRYLDIAGASVNDAQLGHIRNLTKLTTLNLSDTHVSDAGLRNLKQLTRLLCLCLNSDHISDAGLRHLKKLTQLRSLGVGHTNVTEGGAESLHKALPHCGIGWRRND